MQLNTCPQGNESVSNQSLNKKGYNKAHQNSLINSLLFSLPMKYINFGSQTSLVPLALEGRSRQVVDHTALAMAHNRVRGLKNV